MYPTESSGENGGERLDFEKAGRVELILHRRVFYVRGKQNERKKNHDPESTFQ